MPENAVITGYSELLNDCRTIISLEVGNAYNLVIKANYRLGKRINEEFLKDQTRSDLYGKKLINHLAADLKMHPQRLYECVRIARKFDSVEDILTLAENAGIQNITWNLIIKKMLPDQRQDPDEIESTDDFWENKFKRWELVLSEIDECLLFDTNIPDEKRKELKGLYLAAKEKIKEADTFMDEYRHKDKDLKEALKERIEYDEVTGEGLLLEKRMIHHIKTRGSGGGDFIGNMIIVSKSTHKRIHDGEFSKTQLLKEVNKRNGFLAQYLLMA